MKKKAIPPLYVLAKKELQAEFVGTFMVTLVAMWSIIYYDLDLLSLTGVALSHTVVVLVSMLFLYKISGAHLNPALTLGLIVVHKVQWFKGLHYIAAQFMGALLAAIVTFLQMSEKIFSRTRKRSIMGIPYPQLEGSPLSEFVGEILGNFLLVYVYMSIIAYKTRKQSYEIGIVAFSFSIFAISMTFGQLSGACLNPARSLAPSIIVGAISKNQFYQIFGPIIGSILGSLTYSFLYIDEDDDEFEEAVEAPTKSYTQTT